MTHDDSASHAHGGLGPRTSEGLRRALDLAFDGSPTPDGMPETTWMRGRRVRRRRVALTSGATAAVLASTVLGWSLLSQGGAPGGDAIPGPAPAGSSQTSSQVTTTSRLTQGPVPESRDGLPPAEGESRPPADPEPTLVETAPEPTQSAPDVIPVDASAETERVWAVLRRACLEERGYEVWVDGSSLSASQSGAIAGDYTRDTSLCDAELAMRLPPVDLTDDSGAVSAAAQEALGEVYDSYESAAECVVDLGLPVDDAPTREEFVDLFAREWMPSWHPWTAAAAAGDYARVRTACPIGG